MNDKAVFGAVIVLKDIPPNEMQQAEILVQEHVAAQERVTGAQHFHDMKTKQAVK